MGDILRIYSGGAQVNLYDSTNGILALGAASEEISIESEQQLVPVSDGNRVQVEEIVSFEASLLQTDETRIDNLMARKGYLQEVYIVGIDSAFKIRDVFIRIKEIRSMKGGEAHMVTISGSRYKQTVAAVSDLPETNYCQFMQNLLGGFGAILGAASYGTGWAYLGATGLSLETSHLGGEYGNEQRVTLADNGDFITCRLRFPIGEMPIKFTASAYIDNTKAGASYFFIGVRTKDVDDGVLDTNMSAEKTLAQSADGRQSFTVEFIPTTAVQFIEIVIQGGSTASAEIGFDNAQLEIGGLTAYLENA